MLPHVTCAVCEVCGVARQVVPRVRRAGVVGRGAVRRAAGRRPRARDLRRAAGARRDRARARRGETRAHAPTG